jgi:ATP-dependent DNA ligase
VTGWPYERRRAALETLFADHRLEAPLTLCPSTTEPAVACGWLAWTAAGLEGLCFKRLDEPYVRGRSIVAEVQGAGYHRGRHRRPRGARTMLLGRYDTAGRLQYTGRSTTLSCTTASCSRPHTPARDQNRNRRCAVDFDIQKHGGRARQGQPLPIT